MSYNFMTGRQRDSQARRRLGDHWRLVWDPSNVTIEYPEKEGGKSSSGVLGLHGPKQNLN